MNPTGEGSAPHDAWRHLLDAYRSTAYRVLSTPPFTLWIDRHSEELAKLYAVSGVTSAAFITAWNPYSMSLSHAENMARNEALTAALREAGLTNIVPGLGEDPSGEWPGEESVLVLGITREFGRALSTRFQQNAFVWAGSDAKPELIITV